MRLATILTLLLTLAACTRPAAPTRGGIVSTNPCADQILVSLVEPERIAAISHYSKDPAASSLPPEVARRYRATSGTAEEVIALRPDLVVTSTFTPAATRAAYERAGLKVLLLDSPTTVAGSKAQIMELARAVDRPGRGQALVARIDEALAATAPHDAARPSALLYISGDLVTGRNTLLDELMTHVGLRDAAADYGLSHTGRLPLETILEAPPQLIMAPEFSTRASAIRSRVLTYRTRQAVFPRTLVNCGGPTIVPAVEQLAAIRRQILQ
ncbi:MAG TPA: ABC transporter substrate-binding protein [Sphingomonas sp.]|nr:ABC transporter substrate-binding protein [Sphingomonas sp.]